MKIFVKAKPKSKKEKIERVPQEISLFDDDGKNKNKTENAFFVVAVKEPPIKGRANKAIIKVLANYFNIPLSQIKFVSGEKSKNKVFVIE